MDVFDAAQRYSADGAQVIILAGKDYGSGSSRDWAAKGPYLQGVRAVIAESYERIHRSEYYLLRPTTSLPVPPLPISPLQPQ